MRLPPLRRCEPVATAATTIDEYLAGLDEPARGIAEGVHAAIRRALPDAEERIRYGMPAVMLGPSRYAIHFAAWKKHIGIYPVTTLPEPLEAEVAPYRHAKDTVRLMYRDPIPYDLIERMAVALRDLRG